MAIEDAHQPGAERTALLEARESTPGQQKGSLRYILRQRALGLPEVPESVLVSTSRSFDECIIPVRHACPPSVALLHQSVAKTIPTPLSHTTRTLYHSLS